jgi:ADP-ribose pyrophosphatase YjhB (NUDIX family)
VTPPTPATPAQSRRSKPDRALSATVEEVSAGGLVVDRSGSRPQVPLIGRYDRRGRMRWSMPKGHVEPGETAEQAAMREVAEETGIRGRVGAPLGVIRFSFRAEDRRVRKTVHHFLLLAEGGELSDADDEVAAVEWVALHDLGTRLAYADERRLAESVPGLLASSA